MNRYLREQAKQDSDKGLSRTFVNLAEDAQTIIGYYTLALKFLAFENIPQEKRLSRYPAQWLCWHGLLLTSPSKGRGSANGSYSTHEPAFWNCPRVSACTP